jgi:hypothetical protein
VGHTGRWDACIHQSRMGRAAVSPYRLQQTAADMSGEREETAPHCYTVWCRCERGGDRHAGPARRNKRAPGDFDGEARWPLEGEGAWAQSVSMQETGRREGRPEGMAAGVSTGAQMLTPQHRVVSA